MKISQEQLDEFKEIYFQELGEVLSDDEAYKQGMRVINFVRTINRLAAKGLQLKKQY